MGEESYRAKFSGWLAGAAAAAYEVAALRASAFNYRSATRWFSAGTTLLAIAVAVAEKGTVPPEPQARREDWN